MSKQVGITTSKGFHETDGTALEIIKDENGVLKCGDTIIPQKKLVMNQSVEVSTAGEYGVVILDATTSNLISGSLKNKVFEIELGPTSQNPKIVKIKANTDISANGHIMRVYTGGTFDLVYFYVRDSGTKLYCKYSNGNAEDKGSIIVSRIWEVIE